MNDKCSECGGTKDGINTETGEQVCNNRSCSESPMNEELTIMP